MKALKTLIKLSTQKLDALRIEMGDLQNQKTQLEHLTVTLEDELKHEIAKAEEQPEMSQFFGGFSARIKERQDVIAGEIQTLEGQMDALSDTLAEAFAEVKRYEIALEQAIIKERKEKQRQETIVLDEIAGEQHRRKSQTEDV